MYELRSRPSKGTPNALFMGEDGLTGWQRETLKTGVAEWLFTGGGCHIYAVELARHLQRGTLAVLNGIPASSFGRQDAAGFHAFLLEDGCMIDVAGIRPLRSYVEQVVAQKWGEYCDFKIVETSAQELLQRSPAHLHGIKNKWGHWVNDEFVKHAQKIARDHVVQEWGDQSLEFPYPVTVELTTDAIPRIQASYIRR